MIHIRAKMFSEEAQRLLSVILRIRVVVVVAAWIFFTGVGYAL
jgi:hypothetical protein